MMGRSENTLKQLWNIKNFQTKENTTFSTEVIGKSGINSL